MNPQDVYVARCGAVCMTHAQGHWHELVCSACLGEASDGDEDNSLDSDTDSRYSV